MREKTEKLLEKYYDGETSLAEERELRELLLKVPGFQEEKQFFLGLEVLKAIEPRDRPVPKAKGELSLWLKIAAVITLFLSLSWLFVDQQSKKEEALAYAQVMEAFSLIQENLKKGTAPLEAIQDMRYLNKPNEIFNIKNKEEQ